MDVVDEYPSSYEALLIVDAEARIQFTFWNIRTEERAWMLSADASQLSETVATRFREIVGHHPSVAGASDVVVREGAKTLRLSRLDGNEALYALVLESDRNDGKMLRATSRYQLTRRQSEVLALLLDGASASDVAHALVISEYTAQGYVKCLLTKTSSRNRAEMIAKVLDWKPSPAAAKMQEHFRRAQAN